MHQFIGMGKPVGTAWESRITCKTLRRRAQGIGENNEVRGYGLSLRRSRTRDRIVMEYQWQPVVMSDDVVLKPAAVPH